MGRKLTSIKLGRLTLIRFSVGGRRWQGAIMNFAFFSLFRQQNLQLSVIYIYSVLIWMFRYLLLNMFALRVVCDYILRYIHRLLTKLFSLQGNGYVILPFCWWHKSDNISYHFGNIKGKLVTTGCKLTRSKKLGGLWVVCFVNGYLFTVLCFHYSFARVAEGGLTLTTLFAKCKVLNFHSNCVYFFPL